MEEKVLEESEEMKIRIQKGNQRQITAYLRFALWTHPNRPSGGFTNT